MSYWSGFSFWVLIIILYEISYAKDKVFNFCEYV